jgi:hypothetical protein
MMSNIYLVGADNSLTELIRTPYDSEDLLQRLIADHPAVLRSAVGSDGELLLVRREHTVPDSDGGAARWSLDHLFLDAEGVPILVEVKRASDTRARREVVAQMLDYAANGVAYWPVENIIEAFKQTAHETSRDADALLAQFLGERSPDTYWRTVEANLRSGRIRMVFLADEISKELRRIVEFMNEQMRPAEVLAVELVQYVNAKGMRTLVPTLVGATERAQTVKSPTTPLAPIGEDDWLDTLASQKGAESLEGARKAIAWARAKGLSVDVSKSQDSLYASKTLQSGKTAYPFFIRRSTGNFEVSLANLKSVPAFHSDDARLAILDRMKRVPGVSIATTKATGWPPVPLAMLNEPAVWSALKPILDDVVAAIVAKSAVEV